MVRESLPLLIALLLPLAGLAGLLPAIGRDAGGPMPVPAGMVAAGQRAVLLPLPAATPLPVAGVWLNF